MGPSPKNHLNLAVVKTLTEAMFAMTTDLVAFVPGTHDRHRLALEVDQRLRRTTRPGAPARWARLTELSGVAPRSTSVVVASTVRSPFARLKASRRRARSSRERPLRWTRAVQNLTVGALLDGGIVHDMSRRRVELGHKPLPTGPRVARAPRRWLPERTAADDAAASAAPSS